MSGGGGGGNDSIELESETCEEKQVKTFKFMSCLTNVARFADVHKFTQ